MHLLLVRGFFRPVPYLAFPLYLNCKTGNGTETRHTIFVGDSIIVCKVFFKTVYYVITVGSGIINHIFHMFIIKFIDESLTTNSSYNGKSNDKT